MVALGCRNCNVYRKGEDGLWVLHPFEAEQGVALASVHLTIAPEPLWAEID